MPPILQADRPAAKAPAVVVPFVRASARHVEPAFDRSDLMGAATITRNEDIPAYGYMRALWLFIVGTGGVLGAGVLQEDYPWSSLSDITLSDVNGAPIFGPHTGYDVYLINKYGGYAWDADPINAPGYVSTINTTCFLRIPIEITGYDGYGSLANQSAASTYKFRYSVAASGTAFTTAPTTPPTIRVRGSLEAWMPPAGRDSFGNAQETEPPGHGTTQFWSQRVENITTGSQTVQLKRVGQLIRTLILIARDNASPSVRTTAMFPDTITVTQDSRQVFVEPIEYRRVRMREDYGFVPDTGVLVYTFADDQDGHPGSENRNLYVPTVQASRLEIAGTFDATGTLRILTNDVAPVGGR